MSDVRPVLARLGQATVNYGLGSILPKVIGFLLIPLYTVFLSPTDYGVVDVVSVFTALLVVVMRLGVPGAVTRFFFEHRDGEGLRDYVTTIARFLNVVSVIVGVGAALAVFLFPLALLGGVELWPLGAIGILSALFTSNTDLQRRLVQAREQSAYSARLSVVTAVANIVLSIVLVAGLRLGALGLLLATLVSNAAFFVQAHLYLRPDLGGRFRADMLRSSMRYAAGILPSHLIVHATPVATRAILASFESLAAVGLLGIATRFASPLTVLAGALNSAFLPIYFAARTALEDQRDKIMQMERTVYFVTGAFFVAAVTGGPALITVMTPASYDGAGPLFSVLALGFVAQVAQTLLGSEIFYVRTPWIVPVISLLSVAVTLILTWALIARLGALGLAIAQSAGLWVSAVASAIASHRLRPMPHAWRDGGKTLVAVGAALALALAAPPTGPVLTGLVAIGCTAAYLVAIVVLRHGAVSDVGALWRARR